MSEYVVQQESPEDVFPALADETRLEIIQVLWNADEKPIPFSELHDMVSIRDSGQFNYHLDKLIGRFIQKTEDGYQLTQAGRNFNGAIASGMYTGQTDLPPIELSSTCRSCGGEQTLHYESEVAEVECMDCEVGWSIPVPPAVLAGFSHEEIPQVVSSYFVTRFQKIINGFCSYCNGQTDPTVQAIRSLDVGPDPDGDSVDPSENQPLDLPAVQFDCTRCGAIAGLGLDYALMIAHPPISYWYYMQGIDLHRNLIWDESLDLSESTIDQEDPFRASVAFGFEDADLTTTVNGEFNIVDSDAPTTP